jgi:hypothetical protein
MVSKEIYQNYGKALVLGTGEGNDLVSATLVATYLIERFRIR